MRISETPSPTESQSPKLPSVALRRRAKILAFAFWSVSPDNHASNSDDRRNIIIWLIVSNWIHMVKLFLGERNSRKKKRREARPRNRVGAAAGLALGRKKMRGRLDRPHLKGAAGQRLVRSGRFRESNHSPGFRARANRLRQAAGRRRVVLGQTRQCRPF